MEWTGEENPEGSRSTIEERKVSIARSPGPERRRLRKQF
jgi:hypothetical protein